MIIVNSKIIEDIEQYYRGIMKNVYPGDFRKLAREAIDEKRIEEQIRELSRRVGINIKGAKLLEIGSGAGGFVILSRLKYGAESYGVEPDEVIYNIAIQILSENKINPDVIKKSPGEKLPFEDESFDIVYSTNVLEHVMNPEKTISESLRVLKKGGFLQFVIPNYGSFYEGHYGIFWIPYIPKWIAKVYVSLYGRNPKFIDTLQFINYWQIKDILSKYQNIKIINWGEDVFEERLIKMNFSEWAELKKVKKMVDFAHRLKVVSLIRVASRIFKFHIPIILTLQKT